MIPLVVMVDDVLPKRHGPSDVAQHGVPSIYSSARRRVSANFDNTSKIRAFGSVRIFGDDAKGLSFGTGRGKPKSNKIRAMLRVILLIPCALLFMACESRQPEPLVALFCLDGATPEALDRLRSEGNLPNIDRLIRSGSWGPLESLGAKRVLQSEPRRGYWSPILWASVATGVVPEKHGIRDFLLPMPGTAFAWIGDDEGPPRADLKLPEINGHPPYTLHLRLRSFPPNGPQDVRILLNGSPLASVTVPTQWREVTAEAAEGLFRPAQNRLELVFSKQSKPSDRGKSKDRRSLAGAFAELRVADARGAVVASVDPVYQRFSLGKGFRLPQAELVEAQSTHFKASTVWSLLGDRGHRVGVVGYWSTWPVYEVNGFLVSSRMGLRGRRQGTRKHLTWPAELAEELQSLRPTRAEMKEVIAELYPPACKPAKPKSLSVFEQVLWQDKFYFRVARKLLPMLTATDGGFFTVYFESIDVGSHTFLPYRHGAALPPHCPETVREVVDRSYQQIDAWIGELLTELPGHATAMVISDHGMVTADNAGYHAPYGVFVASGPAIRRGALRGANVLDIAPTVLQLFGAPIPLEMDGKVIVQAFKPEWLAANPPRYQDIDIANVERESATLTEDTEEVIERLKSIGYIK